MLHAYRFEPRRHTNGCWVDGYLKVGVSNNLFQFIQWEDENPYNISELIEEYESEETEVKKDLEWAIKEIEGLETESSQNYPHDEMIEKEIVLGILNQLDEPEVLSQEWIDEYAQGDYDEWVYTEDLQKLLVPKQELPVIPQFVAEWLEETKPYNSLRVAFEYIAQRKRDNHDDELAFWVEEGNSEAFARAWLDGYTVEEEQKYYVLDKKGHLLIRGFSDGTVGRVGDRMKPDLYPDWNKKNLPLTEQEIKDYDERYWPFAVKVEEMEE